MSCISIVPSGHKGKGKAMQRKILKMHKRSQKLLLKIHTDHLSDLNKF